MMKRKVSVIWVVVLAISATALFLSKQYFKKQSITHIIVLCRPTAKTAERQSCNMEGYVVNSIF